MDLGDSVWYMERGILNLHELVEHADEDDVASVSDHDYERLSRLCDRLCNCLHMIRDAKDLQPKR